MTQQQAAPVKPQQEGSRWRHAKPSSEEVGKWFADVPLDEGMEHAKYVSGVVIIPATEKVKRPKADGKGTEEVWDDTFTPYVRVDTRVAYFHQLAAKRDCIARIEPVLVPRSEQPAFDNRHLPDGFFWHILGESQAAQRFLCCTMRVALYERRIWLASKKELRRRGERRVPILEGIGTKQIADRTDRYNNRDTNALAKGETGAIGRALGVAGILVVGTGIATAEDMQELMREPTEAAPVTLPAAGAGEETDEQLNERLGALEARLRPYTDAWREFTAWWAERAKASGWQVVRDAPIEARRGVASKMEQMIAEQPEVPPAPEPDPAEAVTEA
jgi:hypothetical protein